MKLSEIQLVSEIQALFQENNEYEAIKADIAERGINVICGWKPILIFQKEPKKKLDKTIVDLIDFEVMDKTLHDWQQGERVPVFLVKHFTEVGDIVCDPFAGTGTFLLAAHKLNRIAIGIDKDEQNINIVKGRISEQQFACAQTV